MKLVRGLFEFLGVLIVLAMFPCVLYSVYKILTVPSPDEKLLWISAIGGFGAIADKEIARVKASLKERGEAD